MHRCLPLVGAAVMMKPVAGKLRDRVSASLAESGTTWPRCPVRCGWSHVTTTPTEGCGRCLMCSAAFAEAAELLQGPGSHPHHHAGHRPDLGGSGCPRPRRPPSTALPSVSIDSVSVNAQCVGQAQCDKRDRRGYARDVHWFWDEDASLVPTVRLDPDEGALVLQCSTPPTTPTAARPSPTLPQKESSAEDTPPAADESPVEHETRPAPTLPRKTLPRKTPAKPQPTFDERTEHRISGSPSAGARMIAASSMWRPRRKSRPPKPHCFPDGWRLLPAGPR